MAHARTLVFVGGGTGGHLQPGVVLRDALLRRHPDWRAEFLIAGREVEKNFVPPEATCLELFPGMGSRPAPWRADLYVRAFWSASRVLAELSPDLLVFLGGYVAFIARLARLRVPMVILESNALPGRSVRLAAPFAKRIFTQWEPAPDGHLPAARVAVTGMPLKFDVLPGKREARARLRLNEHRRVLLVLGGSLGAQAINERMIAGAAALAAAAPLTLVHVTGTRDEERVHHAYAMAGVDARVLPFSDEMGTLYAASDLIVARGGGMTVAEIAAAGRAALVVPYPHHDDLHQERNAGMLADAGAAWMVRESESGDDFVQRHVLPRLADLEDLERRGRIALSLSRRDSTRRIVEEIERLLDLEIPTDAPAVEAQWRAGAQGTV
ncbi:MAG TPA: UDP-N-acetylglucosamine--N-acetylmuramyl-(pentapeptide) pyrophosphoryl-undecaprenol N-acetylglucosamine transferase [Planctomycetota bacterium]|jgi:UDP-N-acetylglucosamine--N-acetylmuramyl-(pentapeptide) pyrophosphoryl-undecaprenol N-acetylglucosamine transferase|nr:UDP-N-acetylglucosamine--N-acetylmuramyl-(pentapeptide) pyrophosphoryl-undecaprenol N-acetylglucosamine transferase [Planctomycetota bacterium]